MKPHVLDLKMELKSLKSHLPDANKGDFGRVLIIGGDADMSDVLSGIIGGLVAQGLDTLAAARLVVIAHATAGDILEAEEGQIGMLASDLIPKVRRIFNAK